MFYGCKSLTQAPTLLATTLARNCYTEMFHDCTNIPEPKYIMSNMTFNKVASNIQNNDIFDYGGYDFIAQYEVQCSDKILIATHSSRKWTITEK